MDILIILLHHGYTNYIIILPLYGGGHCNNNESPSPQKTTTRIPLPTKNDQNPPNKLSTPHKKVPHPFTTPHPTKTATDNKKVRYALSKS